MIRVYGSGSLEERLRRIEQSINRSPLVLCRALTNEAGPNNIGTTETYMGGLHVDRAWFQQIAPDAQWRVRAAGWLDAADANGVRVRLQYQKNDATAVSLGSATFTGAGYTKRALGPFDVFATAGVPTNEAIPNINLTVQKLVSGTGSFTRWTLWLELATRDQ